jgi:hypothetical protein
MTIETEDVVADVLAAFKALRSDHLPTLEELARTAVAATPSERLREENARREWQPRRRTVTPRLTCGFPVKGGCPTATFIAGNGCGGRHAAMRSRHGKWSSRLIG